MDQHSTADLEAVVFLDNDKQQAAGMRVAGLPLLKRTWRILKRAGIRRVKLVGGQDPQAYSGWASQSGLDFVSVPSWEADGCPALLFPADLAFQHDFFHRFLKDWQGGQGQWRTLTVEGDQHPAVLLGQGLEGRFSSFGQVQNALQSRHAENSFQAADLASGCQRISGKDSARCFHRSIEKTMVKPTDGLFAQWNRKISIPLTRILALLPVTPNQVTYLTLLVSVWGAYWLSLGGYGEMLVGALLTQLASVLDGNDGELARLRILDSDYGSWLDTICDYISYFFTFGGICYGLFNRTGDSLYLILGGVMFAGILVAMLLTSRLRSKYTAEEGAGALTSVVVETLHQKREADLWARLSHRLRHFGTRATFSYFIVILALLDWWVLLIGITTLGAHLYWVMILYNEKFLKQRR